MFADTTRTRSPASTHWNRPHRSTCFKCPSTRCSSPSDSDRNSSQRRSPHSRLVPSLRTQTHKSPATPAHMHSPSLFSDIGMHNCSRSGMVWCFLAASIGSTEDLSMQQQCGMRSRIRGVHHQHSVQDATGCQARALDFAACVLAQMSDEPRCQQWRDAVERYSAPGQFTRDRLRSLPRQQHCSILRPLSSKSRPPSTSHLAQPPAPFSTTASRSVGSIDHSAVASRT